MSANFGCFGCESGLRTAYRVLISFKHSYIWVYVCDMYRVCIEFTFTVGVGRGSFFKRSNALVTSFSRAFGGFNRPPKDLYYNTQYIRVCMKRL
jgi:hypothetical protein